VLRTVRLNCCHRWTLIDLTITKLCHQYQLLKRYAWCASADGLSGEGEQHAEVELLSWKKVTDITKDGGVIKKTLNESTDYKTATVESTVKVRCVSLAAIWGATTQDRPAKFCLPWWQHCLGASESNSVAYFKSRTG